MLLCGFDHRYQGTSWALYTYSEVGNFLGGNPVIELVGTELTKMASRSSFKSGFDSYALKFRYQRTEVKIKYQGNQWT